MLILLCILISPVVGGRGGILATRHYRNDEIDTSKRMPTSSLNPAVEDNKDAPFHCACPESKPDLALPRRSKNTKITTILAAAGAIAKVWKAFPRSWRRGITSTLAFLIPSFLWRYDAFHSLFDVLQTVGSIILFGVSGL
mmetsp:Transcript_2763/g.3806  ORF Transcript_2763/g.3806 Transcript_2763/m.3806 type:complete len:140 (+) Transcript_2763:87-506(+)